ERELAAKVEDAARVGHFVRGSAGGPEREGQEWRAGRREPIAGVGLTGLHVWRRATTCCADGEPGDRGQKAVERDDAGSGAHRQRDPSLVGGLCNAKRLRLRLVSAPARDGTAW